MSASDESGRPARHDITTHRVLALVSDLPLGHLTFIGLVLGGLLWTLCGDLPSGDYVGAVAAASGLLAVGHGIRHHGR